MPLSSVKYILVECAEYDIFKLIMFNNNVTFNHVSPKNHLIYQIN